ncbi:50S ribosomal protein L9 [Candidatus Calescamantes bacterium]|nr:50S ribosomal protein L9 [Candidatus Calescamantes bacterium]
MKVILRENISKLGRIGDVVDVKPGYARNYLFPRGLALPATEGNLKKVEEEKRIREKKEEKIKEEARNLARKLQKKSITIPVQVGEEEQLFGSVTAQDIANALVQEGFPIDKKHVVLEEPIKALGIYNVEIKLHPEVSTTIRVWVVKS